MTGIRSAVIGPNLIFEAYRTAVATIVVGLDADVTVITSENAKDATKTGPLSVIAPGTHCRLKTAGSIALLFCDALSDDYACIDLRGMDNNIVTLRKRLRSGPVEEAPDDFMEQAFRLIGVTSEPTSRPDIARIVTAIGKRPEHFPSVEYAAELAGLSPMRFQHVFTETVGMPFRRYRQWRRMGQVIRSIAGGASLTKAAHATGFASSSHLSSAFKAMFGLRPSDLLARQVEYYLSEAPSNQNILTMPENIDSN